MIDCSRLVSSPVLPCPVLLLTQSLLTATASPIYSQQLVLSSFPAVITTVMCRRDPAHRLHRIAKHTDTASPSSHASTHATSHSSTHAPSCSCLALCRLMLVLVLLVSSRSQGGGRERPATSRIKREHLLTQHCQRRRAHMSVGC